MESIEALKRILQRERMARKHAEAITESKALELFTLNEQLKKLNESLEQEVQNRTLALENKIKELKEANKYKNEFLANMSHELRTPLNSILVLSRLLSQNKKNNLTSKQIEHTQIIHNSGNDLLLIINDILDLAKVEAGQITAYWETITLDDIISNLENSFKEIAKEKGINFVINISPNLPSSLITDKSKTLQILRNLLSNAFKFSQVNNKVILNIYLEDNTILFEVIDNGIGIPKDKLAIIFEAFHQADGSTSRQYGGTGLGLSICKQFSHLLGGDIFVKSTINIGSTFTLKLPLSNLSFNEHTAQVNLKNDLKNNQKTKAVIKDDRHKLEVGEYPLLIIEDDIHFAKILKDYAHNRGFKVLITTEGEEGIQLAKQYKPITILLDIELPVLDGWEVLKTIKENEITNHIPVHIFSVINKVNVGLEMGANSYKIKPGSIQEVESTFDSIKNKPRPTKKAIVLSQNQNYFPVVYQKLQEHFIDIKYAPNCTQIFDLLQKEQFQLITIIDTPISQKFITQLNAASYLQVKPLKVFLGDLINVNLDWAAATHLKLIKDCAMLNQIFQLNLDIENDCPHTKKLDPTAQFEAIHQKSILIVDDEMRNIFAFDSILEPFDINLHIVHNGLEALQILERDTPIDLVLMDIMMPIMDGYEATKRIRKQAKFDNLPIVAVTAKAMKGDFEKCLDAGANAYISKPIDIDDLLTTMNDLLL